MLYAYVQSKGKQSWEYNILLRNVTGIGTNSVEHSRE